MQRCRQKMNPSDFIFQRAPTKVWGFGFQLSLGEGGCGQKMERLRARNTLKVYPEAAQNLDQKKRKIPFFDLKNVIGNTELSNSKKTTFQYPM